MTGDLVLLAFAIVVAVFAGASWFRLMWLLKQDADERRAVERWYAEKTKYRTSSGIADDSPDDADSRDRVA